VYIHDVYRSSRTWDMK